MIDSKLQTASRLFVERFSPFLTHMITLNLLDTRINTHIRREGWAKGAIEHKESGLTDDAALASIRYFIEVLNFSLHGWRTRKNRYKDVCRILAIPVIEGTKGNKRRHFHVLLGNVPAAKLAELERLVADAWARTKWGMPGVNVIELYDGDGAAFYTGKEVGYQNEDAVLWQHASIPRRLAGASA